MSHRASFNIRKLIKTWPDHDDNRETDGFECSSARTIRKQYELEQYQTQHNQQKARHEHHKHRSWMSHAGSAPKTTNAHRNDPKPITVATPGQQPTDNALAKRPNASRRISMPLTSQQPSRTSSVIPPVPSQESGSSRAGAVSISQDSRRLHIAQARRSPETAGGLSPEFSQVDWASRNGPLSAPLTKEPSPRLGDTQHFPVSGRRARGQSTSSIWHPSPTPPANIQPHEIPETTTAMVTSANSATNRSNKASYVMNGHVQEKPSAFVHGQPSPPLEPDEYLTGVVNSSDALREMASVSSLSLGGENTWFDEHSSNSPDGSDNVQQLMRETDEAFKAVSSALAEARTFPHTPPPSMENLKSPLQLLQHASQVLHEPATMAKPGPIHKLPLGLGSASAPIHAPAGRGVIAPRVRQGSKPDTPVNTKTSSTLQSPVIVASSNAKQKKAPKLPAPAPKAMVCEARESSASTKVQAKGHAHRHGHHHSVQKSITKLNQAADKVTDKLFEGRVGRAGRFGFHKIEADEVISSEQLEQFRQNRLATEAAAAAKRKASIETLGSVADITDETSMDADLEPCPPHVQPCKIGHLGASALSPVIEVATPDFFRLNKAVMGEMPISASKDSSKSGQDPLVTPPPTPPQHILDTASEDDDSMHLKTRGLSKLAHKRPVHKRSGSSVSHMTLLPTIPEVKIQSPSAWDASRISGSRTSEQAGRRTPTPTDANGNPYFEEDEDHMYFLSNPVTATMPTIHHGRIRLAKDDLVNAGTINSLESKLLLSSPDETLDWTAFQMAILGGAGDLFSDPDNFLSRDEQEQMVDDLCDWLEDLEYTNSDLGSLIRTDKPRKTIIPRPPRTPTNLVTPGSVNRSFHDPSHYRRRRPQHSPKNSSSSTASSSSSLGSGLTRSGDSPDHSIPIALEVEHPSGFWNATSSSSSPSAAAQQQHQRHSDRFNAGPRLKRWTLEGHPKRPGAAIDVQKANALALSKPLPMTPGSAASAAAGEAAIGVRRELKNTGGSRVAIGAADRVRAADAAVRESIVSLPQSPMLELRMITGVDGSKDFVSMGYNLNHDLGDFLKWESEHVYASGFYGADD